MQLLLLLSGDVESNPGPPKRGAPAKAAEPKKEETKEEMQIMALESKVTELVNNILPKSPNHPVDGTFVSATSELPDLTTETCKKINLPYSICTVSNKNTRLADFETCVFR